jgi:hypothetical protein
MKTFVCNRMPRKSYTRRVKRGGGPNKKLTTASLVTVPRPVAIQAVAVKGNNKPSQMKATPILVRPPPPAAKAGVGLSAFKGPPPKSEKNPYGLVKIRRATNLNNAALSLNNISVVSAASPSFAARSAVPSMASTISAAERQTIPSISSPSSVLSLSSMEASSGSSSPVEFASPAGRAPPPPATPGSGLLATRGPPPKTVKKNNASGGARRKLNRRTRRAKK